MPPASIHCTHSFIDSWIHSPAFSTILHYFCGYFCCCFAFVFRLLLLLLPSGNSSSSARRGSLSFFVAVVVAIVVVVAFVFAVKVIVVVVAVGGALESTRFVPNIYCQIMIIVKVKWPDSSCPTRNRNQIRFEIESEIAAKTNLKSLHKSNL